MTNKVSHFTLELPKSQFPELNQYLVCQNFGAPLQSLPLFPKLPIELQLPDGDTIHKGPVKFV